MTLELNLIQTTGLNDADDFYSRAYKIPNEVEGEKFSYVVAPRTLIDVCNEGQFGFIDDGRVFVDKNLPIGLVPFVAFYYHLTNLKPSDIAKKVDYKNFQDLDENSKSTYLACSVIKMASQYLRNDEALYWYNSIANQDWFNQEIGNIFLKGIDKNYSASSSDKALALHNAHLYHYQKTREKYLVAYGNNKFIKLSQAMNSLVESFSELETLLHYSVTKADRAYSTIINNDEYRKHLYEIARVVQNLSSSTPGTQFKLSDFMTNRLFYDFIETFNNDERLPFKYVDEDTEDQTNTIILTGSSHDFFSSLDKRLSLHVMQEQKAIKQIFSENVLPSSPEAIALSSEGKQSLDEIIHKARFIIAQSPDSERKIINLGYALKILEEHGVDTDKVEHEIQLTHDADNTTPALQLSNNN